MVKLADLVHIANNAKTDAQKNAVGEQVKKFLRGKKACDSDELFSNVGIRIEKGKNLRKLGQGVYGAVFYGCLEDQCKTKIAMKVTSEPSAKMEYRIAEKLKGMGVPRMYHFKSCGRVDLLYFEYIKGESLERWMKRGQTAAAYRSLISQLIKNLKRIHEKYPKFRHHDLHWNNIMVLPGNKPIMIDFGLSTIEGIRNPDVVSGEFKDEAGIYSGSHYMYDAHYILNIIYNNTKSTKVREFIRDLFPERYLSSTNPYIKSGRLRAGVTRDLPTYDQILEHSFLQTKKLSLIPRRIVKAKTPIAPQPQKVGTASAIRRAKAVLEKEAAKKKVPPKRPGVAAKPKHKIFINKNGDLKIEKRKCRLYKKEDLAKKFNLDPRLTKDQMCKLIKNM